jgi:2-polyprenyl-6-methoxyphenol hydroxylase-like FAD-dependent oxidoreductase
MTEMQSNNKTWPVVVIGAGPVGLALAGDLGWRGVPCLLVERGTGEIHQPKMDLVSVRTMEFCRRWGIVDWVEHAGYNRDYPQDYAWVSSLSGGYEFGREPFPSIKEEPCPPQSPQKRERCPQNFFDPVLRRFVERSALVAQRHRTEFRSMKEHERGVTVQLANLESGQEYEVECQYLIGCDGGASSVKQALGLQMVGSPVLTYTTNAIVECEGLEAWHDKKPGYRYIFIGPEGTWGTMVAINGRDQWRVSLVGDGNVRTLNEDDMAGVFRRMVGRDDVPFKVLSVMPWIRRQLVADNYGRGRTWIAGDAAHLTSPTGGFGMNMGIQDSVGLGWTLAALVQGWGAPRLLQAYEIERRPVAIRNVQEATNNLKNMLSPRDQQGQLQGAFEPGPAGDAARKAFGEAYTAMMKREWHTVGIHLGYRYEGSPVVVPDGTPEPPDTVTTYEQTARPGHRAPHVWLKPGLSTLDLFGRGFVLLRFDPEVSVEAMQAAAAQRGVPLQVNDIGDAKAASLYQRKLVLVRPDGHVAWRGDAMPQDALAVIDTVRGAA